MPSITFESFDPAAYQRAPRGNVWSILSLARALAELAPRDASEAVDRTATSLDRAISEAQQGVATRQRESQPVDTSDDRAIDGCVDSLWGALRDGLEAKAAAVHPGLARVVAEHGKRSAVAAAMRTAADEAARARGLLDRLFAAEGLAFTRKSYSEQSEKMAALLQVIDDDGLAEGIDALLGSQLLVLLRACQPQYEAMVQDRLSRDDRSSTDLSHLRGKLQRAISRYCSAVLTLVDEERPESLAEVLTVLRPVETHRAQASASRGNGAHEADAPEAVADSETGDPPAA
ncbi:MAG: hypothetical protein H6712_04665 [Myxococcales bacterium]|nr:hypothetical protein [Myxococcales bacterium]